MKEVRKVVYGPYMHPSGKRWFVVPRLEDDAIGTSFQTLTAARAALRAWKRKHGCRHGRRGK